MKNIVLSFGFIFASMVFAELPSVSVGELVQDAGSKRVTIPYALTSGDACIVTIDVKTNGPAFFA